VVYVSDTGICAELLQAARHGNDARARALGDKLAATVLASPSIALAHEVLADDSGTTASAVELASRLLSEVPPSLGPPIGPCDRPDTENVGVLKPGARDSKTSKSLDSREIIEGSRHDELARIDVSARELVANGPTERERAVTIEERLAIALERASAVGRWDVVAQLALELEARRLAAPNDAEIAERARGQR
jgi:hypothetical protein